MPQLKNYVKKKQRKRMFFKWLVLGKCGVDDVGREPSQVYRDERDKLKVQEVVDWPFSAGLRGGKEYKEFFEWAKHFNNYHPHITDKFFHFSPIRYQTKILDEQVKSLSVFSQEEKEFLQYYHKLRQWPEFCKPEELFAVMKNHQAQNEAAKILQNFEIEND
jgi:hypothetical protein